MSNTRESRNFYLSHQLQYPKKSPSAEGNLKVSKLIPPIYHILYYNLYCFRITLNI